MLIDTSNSATTSTKTTIARALCRVCLRRSCEGINMHDLMRNRAERRALAAIERRRRRREQP